MSEPLSDDAVPQQPAAEEPVDDETSHHEATAPPGPSRGRAWLVVVLGGALGTLGALISAAQLLSALDGRGASSANLALVTLVFSIVVGGLVASIGFKALGVRPGWRSALLGALVAAVGYFAPFLLGAAVS
ncbi:MAG: hypothetical protein AB7I24_10925 [Candidatus Nanopelagicales bacterium]|jgi:uncharacterized BrkB/YihY/UPF0761 family membrane protein